MKKIFISILSLTILFILSTVACASEPNDQQNGNATPTVSAFRKPQSSEHLMNCVPRQPVDYSDLTFDSSSEERDVIQVERDNSFEDKEPVVKSIVKFEEPLDFTALLDCLEE